MFNIFKDTVYSPCSGVIIQAEDNFIDHNSGRLINYSNTFPNIITIKTSKDIYIQLIHLLNNSILVHKGDSICANQPLALVGNTGRTKRPHLHSVSKKTTIFSKKLIFPNTNLTNIHSK